MMSRQATASFLICICCMAFVLLKTSAKATPFLWDQTTYLSMCSGKGRSYKYGFESIESVACIANTRLTNALFTDLKLLRVEPGKCATNCGIGARIEVTGILGINAFYDTRHECQNSFQQLGFGSEWLTPFFEARINGYLPIGQQERIKKSGNYDYGDGYAVFMKDGRGTMRGFDSEFGTRILENNHCYLYTSCGPYFFESSKRGCVQFYGVMSNIRAVFFDQLKLEFFYTYDNFFKGRPQFICTLAIPFGCNASANSKFIFPVKRNPIILLQGFCEYAPNY